MKAKARMVLAPRVSKIIKWLTFNYDREIGAIGLGEIKNIDGYPSFYVEELYFPEQEVTGVTVSISAAGMVKAKDELGEKMNRMMFYWHRHPSGSAGCSGTDEEDTFASFMSDKAGRKYFTFLQTAEKDGAIVHEARIDVRDPFRVTITNDNIDLKVELTEEDKLVEELCEAAIKEKVTEKTYDTKANYNYNNNYTKPKSKKGETDNKKAIQELFNLKTEPQETLSSVFTEGGYNDIDKSAMAFVNGEVQVMCGEKFAEVLDKNLKDNIMGFARSHKKVKYISKEGWWVYKIQPAANSYDKLKSELTAIYKDYKNEIDLDNEDLITGQDTMKIEDKEVLIAELMGYVYEFFSADYLYEQDNEGAYIDVLTRESTPKYLGSLTIYNNWKSATVSGKELVRVIEKEITRIISLSDDYGYGVEEGIEGEEEKSYEEYSKEIKQLACPKTDKTNKKKGKKNKK